MPFVQVRTLKGALDNEQKRELQRRLTDVMVEIEGNGNEAFRPFVWILISEEDPENWSIAGQAASLEALRAISRPKEEHVDA